MKRIEKQEVSVARPGRPGGTRKTNRPPLTDFMYLVMCAIARLDKDAYSYAIRQYLVDTFRTSCELAQVYVTAKRLVEKGYIKGELLPAPDGASHEVKVYTITPVGRRALERAGKYYAGMATLRPAEEESDAKKGPPAAGATNT